MPPRAACLAAVAALFAAPPAPAAPVSFRNEVMAVLARAGCNQGTCHGNLNGKGGFKLSLRGQDPDADLLALTRDALGRRADPRRAADSLLLRKGTAAVSHEGGKRFGPDSPGYDILLRWLASGARPDPRGTPSLVRLDVTPAERVLVAPADRVALRATATFSDGASRDVTGLAVFEPSSLAVRVDSSGVAVRQADGEAAVLVRYLDRQAVARLAFVPARPGFVWRRVPENNYVDRHVFATLRTLRMNPSPLAPDGVFLRRVYLDTLGVLPTADEARRFLADPSPDKRARLIDELLERPEFADFWALKWSDLLRNEEKALDRKGVQVFHEWLRQWFADGKPLDRLARELIAGRGSTYSDPAANYYRSLRDPYTRAEATAQVFLGVRLQCAKCHNHPFDRWTQEDYHRWAAFFARVRYVVPGNERRDKLDRHEFNGDQVVYQARQGELADPHTGRPLAPHFLGADTPDLAPGADRLGALADWVTRSDNPLFARAQANRVWAHLVGRGVVEPVDDFRPSNPPGDGPLLDALAADLAGHHFDLRHLVRVILTSRTYQLSSAPDETNRDDEAHFSHALVRPLQAEQLFDAAARVTGAGVGFAGQPAGLRAGQLPGVLAGGGRDAGRDQGGDGDRFLRAFGKPERSLSCECERTEDATLAQALQLISGPLLNRMLTQPDNRLGRLLAANRPPAEAVEELYLAALCRPPTAAERDAAAALLAGSSDRRAALEDLTWGLVNAKEFLLRR